MQMTLQHISPFKIIIIVMVLIAIVAVFIACVQDAYYNVPPDTYFSVIVAVA